jgi:hypothetical protein
MALCAEAFSCDDYRSCSKGSWPYVDCERLTVVATNAATRQQAFPEAAADGLNRGPGT